MTATSHFIAIARPTLTARHGQIERDEGAEGTIVLWELGKFDHSRSLRSARAGQANSRWKLTFPERYHHEDDGNDGQPEMAQGGPGLSQ